MKKKSVIVVTEQQFEEVILKSIADKPENFVNFLFKDLFTKSDQNKSEDKTDKEAEYSTSSKAMENMKKNIAEAYKKMKNL
jgi:hypothetical protein